MKETENTETMVPQPGELDRARALLLDWYDRCGRVLPWRQSQTPYAVWVSEIMLQQTRVEAVKPYYARFLSELPDFEALAAAPKEKLLVLWEGLGYYSRVRHMQQAAQIIVSEYGGRMPREYEKVLALPGVGAYTAGAVLSFAYNLPYPAVDGNVQRVLARMCGLQEDILLPATRKKQTEFAAAFLDRERPGDFNQALIDIGATVCLPGGKGVKPKCLGCPFEGVCRAHRMGWEHLLPVRVPKTGKRDEDLTVILLRQGSRFAVRKRPEDGLLGGLYEFPNVPGRLDRAGVEAQVRKWGLTPLAIRPLREAEHVFSHLRWHMNGWMAEVEPAEPDQTLVFVTGGERRERYALPGAFSAYVPYLEEDLSGSETK